VYEAGREVLAAVGTDTWRGDARELRCVSCENDPIASGATMQACRPRVRPAQARDGVFIDNVRTARGSTQQDATAPLSEVRRARHMQKGLLEKCSQRLGHCSARCLSAPQNQCR
jgi:hypothetical protein